VLAIVIMLHSILLTVHNGCCVAGMQVNAYNVALLNGGMGDGSQLLQVDQSAVMYNNLVPLGKPRFTYSLTLQRFLSVYVSCPPNSR